MAIEELAEWIEAHCHQDEAAAADAIGDRLYVLLGDAVATGLNVESILDDVHRSNMGKVAINPQSGKAIKGDRYQPPKFN